MGILVENKAVILEVNVVWLAVVLEDLVALLEVPWCERVGILAGAVQAGSMHPFGVRWALLAVN